MFAVLTWCEWRRPLRRTREPKLTRLARNLGMAVLSAATVSMLDRPVVTPVAALVERRRWGLLPRVPLPAVARDVLGVLLLDYTLYLWHILLHRVPLLWRFHLVHHVDLDLDASTALRFHVGELALSVPYRVAQVAALGITPRALGAWQRLLFASVLFHHSSVRLPISVERLVNRVVVTPRMHGIHHSVVAEDTNSNWSSGLTLWDRLHGTARLHVAQHDLTIGIAAYQDPAELTLDRLLELPFVSQRPWEAYASGATPPRHEDEGAWSGTLAP